MNKLPETSSSKTSQWIECESKKIPGKKYLFNKSTGESKWLGSKPNNEDVPPVEVKKSLKAPANERLKRLQQKLRQEPPKSQKSSKTETAKTVEKATIIKQISEKAVEKEKSTTSSASSSKKTIIKPKERLKTKKVADGAHTVKEKSSSSTKTSTKNPTITPKERLKIIDQKTIKKTEVKKLSSTKTLIVEKKSLTRAANVREIETEAKQKSLNNNSLNIKKQFKIPKLKKKVDNEEIKQQIAEAEKCDLFKQAQEEKVELFKQVEIATVKNPPEAHQHVVELPTESPAKNEVEETPQLKFLESMRDGSSPPKAHLRQEANKRLQKLQEKLQNENKILNNNNTEDLIVLTNAATSECEEMDWEPSIEESNNINSNLTAFVTLTSFHEESTDMEVDDNLMLNAADESFNNAVVSKWRPFSLYIVVDTNVFINQLNFVKFLKNQKPEDAEGVILYLPYSVLQELDKLKLRENIKYYVQSAIRFLNTMFESKDEHVQAQNALENRRHIIDIESSDDKILNCCLQVRENVSKVLLLSEDINLRNKALCNDITVFTKADFAKIGFPNI